MYVLVVAAVTLMVASIGAAFGEWEFAASMTLTSAAVVLIAVIVAWA